MRKNYQGGYITPESDLDWAVAGRLIGEVAARWRARMVVVSRPGTGEAGVDLDHSLEFSRAGEETDKAAADGYYWIGEIVCPEARRKILDAMREGRESDVPHSARNCDVRLRLLFTGDGIVVEARVKLVDGRIRMFEVATDDLFFETVDTMFERHDSPAMVAFRAKIGASAWSPGPEDEA